VTALRVFSMSAGLEASTVTPGRTAPLVSRTVPEMALACAQVTTGSMKIANTLAQATAVVCLTVTGTATLLVDLRGQTARG
jgi:hypothetical protein